LTPEDDLTLTDSLTLESQVKTLNDILNSEFQLEDNVHSLIITFNATRETSDFLLKMPSYTSFKLLSSTLFDSSIKDSHLMIRCLNSSIVWSMTPIEYDVSNEKAQFIWNYQHSLINSKALQEIKQENEVKNDETKEEMELEKLMILKAQTPMAKFEALLLKYRNMHRYDKILGSSELKFLNKINEIIFINESPYDFVTFELFDNNTKEKKGICQICLMDLEENTLNLEFLLDPKLNMVVGTISFLVEFQGNQINQENFYKTLNTKLMLNYDDFNKLNYTRILSNNHEYYLEMEKNIKKSRGNYFTKASKMVKFHLEIEEIWNSFEMSEIPDAKYSEGNFSILCKIGNCSYAIPISFSNIPLDKLKNENANIYKALIYERQMQVIDKKTLNNEEKIVISIYFLGKKDNEVICLSFEKNSNFWVIVENPFVMFSIQLVQKKEILMFNKGFLKDLLVFKDKGVMVLGMEVKNLNKMKNIVGFNSSSVFLKFGYEIREDLDYSKENFTEGLYQVLLIKDEKNIKKGLLNELKQLNYGNFS